MLTCNRKRKCNYLTETSQPHPILRLSNKQKLEKKGQEMKTLIKSLIATSLVVGSLSVAEAKDTTSQIITLNPKTIVALKDMGFILNPLSTPVVTQHMLKRSYYSSSSTHVEGQERACRDSYGQDARIANWEDIENMVDNGGDINTLVDDALFGLRSEKLYINVDGDDHNNAGKYIIQKGNPWMKTITVDNIAKHKLDLKTANFGDFQDTLCYVPNPVVAYVVIRD